MIRRPTRNLLSLVSALAVGLLPKLCRAQDIEPRRWSHMPVGANFAAAAYAYTTGDIALQPELLIENVEVEMQTVALKYIRSFALLGKSARVDVLQPLQFGHWTGVIDGTPAAVTRQGLADTTFRVAVNLFGTPALAGKEFDEYRATKTDRETIVGMGLVMQVPTGQYFDKKLINLGANRFEFRPQLGVVHNLGKWSLELTTQGWFYTDNSDFFGGKRLAKEPGYSADAHLIYTFRPGFWVSSSVGFLGGGETSVDGASSNNRQENVGWGLALGVPLNRAIGLKCAYIGSRTQVATGVDSDTLTVGIAAGW